MLDVMPSQMIADLERDLGLSTDDLARALHMNPRTVDRWRAGDTYPQREARERLNALMGLRRHLSETFRDLESAHSWLRDNNRYLGRLTPVEALRAGRLDRIDAALTALDAGIFI